ncbi:hypothetical protein [Actinobacillus capsulatus]|uniref:hypothetical protein n=1 Tax=Actinobacillus capsulatus TaxID=717 RepID=UPI0003A9CE7F|nr:hypothetical protein [Actinobacillus capsulatus]
MLGVVISGNLMPRLKINLCIKCKPLSRHCACASFVLKFILFKERIKPVIFSGALLSLIGVTWLLSQGDLTRLTHLEINRGDLCTITSTVSWTIYCCIIHLRPSGINNTAFLTALVGLAILTLTPFFLYEFW